MTTNILTDTDIARLKWQCRRGMLELDELLLGFMQQGFAALTALQQQRFVEMLNYPDQLLFDYFFGDATPIDKEVADVITRIQQAAIAAT